MSKFIDESLDFFYKSNRILFFFLLSALILLMFGAKIHTILSKNHTVYPYQYKDTIEFVDKDTRKVIKRFENIELTIIDDNQFMYLTKVKENESITREVLVNNQFPPNSYIRLNCLQE